MECSLMGCLCQRLCAQEWPLVLLVDHHVLPGVRPGRVSRSRASSLSSVLSPQPWSHISIVVSTMITNLIVLSVHIFSWDDQRLHSHQVTYQRARVPELPGLHLPPLTSHRAGTSSHSHQWALEKCVRKYLEMFILKVWLFFTSFTNTQFCWYVINLLNLN